LCKDFFSSNSFSKSSRSPCKSNDQHGSMAILICMHATICNLTESLRSDLADTTFSSKLTCLLFTSTSFSFSCKCFCFLCAQHNTYIWLNDNTYCTICVHTSCMLHLCEHRCMQSVSLTVFATLLGKAQK
jgi:hypothetical protein